MGLVAARYVGPSWIRMKPLSPAFWQADSYPLHYQGSPLHCICFWKTVCIGCCHLFSPSFLLLFFSQVVFHSLRPHGLQHTRLPCPSFSLLKSLLSPPFSWTCFSEVITSHAIRGFICVLYSFCCFKEFLFFPSGNTIFCFLDCCYIVFIFYTPFLVSHSQHSKVALWESLCLLLSVKFECIF